MLKCSLVKKKNFTIPIKRVILSGERPIYMQKACQRKKSSKKWGFSFFVPFSRFFCKKISNRRSPEENRRAEMHAFVQKCTPGYNFNTPVVGRVIPMPSAGCSGGKGKRYSVEMCLHARPSISEKCWSDETRLAPVSIAWAAIQMSFDGMGRPLVLNDIAIRA